MSNPIVHVEVAGFQAPFNEFPPERPDIHDDCGPYANEICVAACEHRAPTTGNMIAIRSRDYQAGRFRVGSGQNLDELEWDVLNHEHAVPITVTKTPMGTHVEGEGGIHEALKAAMLRGNPCVLQVLDAEKLQGNQPGVQHHFVGVGAIHTTFGYKIANGDRVPFKLVGPYWVPWSSILAAQPYGLLEYHMPPPATPPTVDPRDETIAQLKAKIANAQKALA